MGRRPQSAFEDLMEVTAKLPWWAGVGFAIVAYLGLHAIAGTDAPEPKDLHDFSRAASGQLVRALGGIGQYVLPIGFLAGAFVSAIAGWKRRRLQERVAGSPSPNSLERMTWREFEMLVGEEFRRRGYAVEETGGHGADGGVDLVLSQGGERFLVQCKQWKASKVGVKIVRELYGVMTAERVAGGIVVTSGVFTAEAAAFATGKNIDLIDGAELRSMIRGVRERQTPTHDTGATETPPGCPRCGEGMVRRIARRGQNAGKAFWGCNTFPKCRGTLPID